jgi:hypothetical protein
MSLYEQHTRQISELKQEIKELRGQLTLSSNVKTGDLTEIQRKIFDHIKGNVGIIKERVVDWCVERQIASRVTAFNVIKDLEEYGMIIVSTDRRHGANKQKHALFVNDNSLLVEVIGILDEFEERYVTLLEEIPRASAKRRRQSKIDDGNYDSLLSDTIKIHQHLLNLYTVYSMLVWPLKVKDEVILAKLNVIFLRRMLNMQKKMLEKLHLSNRLPLLGKGTIGDMFSPLATNIIRNFSLDLPQYEAIISNSKKLKLERKMKPVLDTLWKLNYQIASSIVYDSGNIRITDFETRHKGILKDLQTALMIRKEQRRKEGKKGRTSISDFRSLGYR